MTRTTVFTSAKLLQTLSRSGTRTVTVSPTATFVGMAELARADAMAPGRPRRSAASARASGRSWRSAVRSFASVFRCADQRRASGDIIIARSSCDETCTGGRRDG